MAKNRKSKKKVTSDQSDVSSTITSVKGLEDMIKVCPSRVCSLFYLRFSCNAFFVYLLITTYILLSLFFSKLCTRYDINILEYDHTSLDVVAV